VFFKELLLSH